MVWDFTSDRGPVERWCPGDSAVDVLSQDVYWDPKYSSNNAEEGFSWVKNRDRGLEWMAKFAAKHKKPMGISEWGSPGGDQSKLEGDKFIRLFVDWIAKHDVVYATYWNAPEQSAYNGKLSEGKPDKLAAVLKKLYQTGFQGISRQ